MKSVYIASPYTIGNKIRNVKVQMEAFNVLLDYGFVPFAPLLTHYQHKYYPRTYEEWIRWCLVWLEKCDIVLRLPGISKGADIETSRAAELGIPVYSSLDALLLWECKK